MKRLVLIPLFFLLMTATSAFADVSGITTLQESVAAAVKHHPQIKSLLYNREAMSSNLTAALGRFFPSLDLTSDAGFQQYNTSTARLGNTEDRTRTATDTTLLLTQNVFDGMDRYNEYQGSKARLTSAEHRLVDNVETVALDAIRAHIDIVRERKLLTLAEENIISHQEVLESIAERVAGGAGSLADEMQARGRVARAETTQIKYSGALRTAEAEYYRLTGMAPGLLDEPEYMMAELPSGLEEVLLKAMENNPKIKIYQAEVEVTEKDRNVTDSELYPNIDIEVSTRNTNQLDGSDTYLQDNRAMLALSWNLFNGGTDYQRIQTANARIREAQEDLRDITDDMTRQVVTAWSEYDTAVKSIEKHMEALSYSMESRDMYLMQFNVGQRSLLDVLDSINEVFSNSVLLETAQSNRNFSLYKLLTLEGILVNSLAVAEKSYETLPN